MNKALCVAVILLGIVALSNIRSEGVPVGPHPPVIVAQAQLVNQSEPINTTTIVTPATDGLYRISVYGTITKAGNGASWVFNPSWVDDTGPQGVSGLIFEQDSVTGEFNGPGGYFQGGAVATFEVKAGQPITYTVTREGDDDGSTYSLYYTLERL